MYDTTPEANSVELATELTIAWLSNPNTRVSPDDVPNFLQSMHAAVTNLATAPTPDADKPLDEHFNGAVSSRKSLASKDHIISMIDGKPYKSLKRHLTRHGLSPQQYRERYGLKPDYPMVAESYSLVRREMAKRIGLGRKPGQTVKKAPSGGPKAGHSPKPRAAPAPQSEG